MRTLRLLAPALALVTALAACGGSSNGEAGKPASRIVDDALAAAKAAKTVHVIGTIDSGGDQIAIDLRLVNGRGGVGTVTYKGDKADVMRVGQQVYFRAPGAFYTHQGAPAAAGQLLADKWIVAPSSNADFADFSSMTDMKALFTNGLKPEGTPAKVGTATVDGVQAVKLVDRKNGKDAGALYVAASGTPYPLKIDSGAASDGTGKVRFAEWNKPVALTAPKGAIDISRLQSGGAG